MRILTAGLIAGLLATVQPANAIPPRVVELTGTATMELNERVSMWDPYDVDPEWVEITFDVTGVMADGYQAIGRGTASIVRGDTVTTIPVQGSMRPPLGSGGEARLGGSDRDGNDYCFVIRDQSDAPSPRPDRTIAAFMQASEGLREFVEYSIEHGAVYTAMDLCADLLYRETWVQSGDYTIAFEDLA